MPHEFIDAHHHLWQYSPEEYPWMLDGMEKIRKDFLVPQLQDVTRTAGVTGTVAVQARQTLEETEWLLNLADGTSLIRGIVGWVPLIEEDIAKRLEVFSAKPKLRGVRHVLHDEQDDLYMLREDFNRGISLLKDFDLVYDILIFERHLPQTLEFVDRHPNQVFVLDHIAKPKIRNKIFSPWDRGITELACRENVYCKISGMVTEADWNDWSESDLRPYFDAVLQAFGPPRVMFGSDWPVIEVACEYGRWSRIVRGWISQQSPADQSAILAETAKKAYSLSL
ncbi:MAG TPA: amidohydrolase family protein [Terriglobales bacterium]|nr:amidohydrolase family protein [Terriglobales bacterium]